MQQIHTEQAYKHQIYNYNETYQISRNILNKIKSRAKSIHMVTINIANDIRKQSCQKDEPDPKKRDLKSKNPPTVIIKKKQNDNGIVENSCFFGKVIFQLSVHLSENSNKNLATLVSTEKGLVDYVQTTVGYRGCGLAKHLIEAFCKDDDAGTYRNGVIPGKRNREISENCKTIKHLQCAPRRIQGKQNVIACSSYIRGASDAGFEMLIVRHKIALSAEKDKTYIFPISGARGRFRANPRGFIENYGDSWYFCKCKESRLGECKQMLHATEAYRCVESQCSDNSCVNR